MTLRNIEQMFNRALLHCFSKKKLLLTFPVLLLCGVLIVFCRALAIGANNWVTMSLTFLPFFLCTSVLLSLGVLLSRIYHNDVKHIYTSYRKLFAQSWELLIGIAYIALPMLLLYLFLWMFLGLFYLLRELPGVGEFFGVILAFGPFLLVFGSISLSLLNVFSLYFITPHVAFRFGSKKRLLQDVAQRFQGNPFSNIVFFLLAVIPLLFIVGLLYLSASVTGATFSVAADSVALVMQWFFIMIPFCALLSPGVLFFVNFSVESFVFLEKRRQALEMRG